MTHYVLIVFRKMLLRIKGEAYCKKLHSIFKKIKIFPKVLKLSADIYVRDIRMRKIRTERIL